MNAWKCVLFATVVACSFSVADQGAVASQPYLGFNGTLVRLPSKYGFQNGIKGMRVISVKRKSPAAQMGLERGDIVVTIDNIGFKSRAGYLAALRMSSQKPSLIVINVRNGRLIRVNCRLPHKRDTREHPDTVGLAIDLAEDMRHP